MEEKEEGIIKLINLSKSEYPRGSSLPIQDPTQKEMGIPGTPYLIIDSVLKNVKILR